jgi:RHS repeat-associated protein
VESGERRKLPNEPTKLLRGKRHTRTDDSYYTNLYDNIGQLKTADSTVASEDRFYGYDAGWNLAKRTNNTTVYTFGANVKNELTNGPTATYGYDNNGNLTSSSSGLVTYTYDAENQLVTWQSSLTAKTDFVYDGRGRLRKRIEYTWNSQMSIWVSAGETRYVYDGMRVIQERNSSNTPQVSYTRGSDLSGSLEGAGGIGGLLSRSHAYQSGSGSFTNNNYYHADGGGNVTMLIETNQTTVATYRYDPYGNTISSSGSLASANVYRFSSKEIHVASGLYYYGYRFYDPWLQRWLTRDPFNERGFQRLRRHVGKRGATRKGENLYMFVVNNPADNFDPVGLIHFDNSCSDEDADAIADAFKSGCDKAKENKCFNKCKGHEGEGDKLCGNGADGKTFSCGAEGDDDCGVYPVTSRCGNTPETKKFGTIVICPTALDGRCGKLECTVMHELAHSIGGKDYQHIKDNPMKDVAYEVEECIGCPGRKMK